MSPVDDVARAIVRHGSSHVQSLWLFGSRAAGCARPGSDIDCLILVDPPLGAWGPRENVGERRRLKRELGAFRPRADLWVRTIDQFEEARDVIGSVEHLAARAGRELFARRACRPAAPARTRDQVRRNVVVDALLDSRSLLARAMALESEEITLPETRGSRGAAHYVLRSIQRAVLAVFFWHQRPTPEKRDAVGVVLDKLSAVDLPLAEAIRLAISPAAGQAEDATRTLAQVIERLQRELPLTSILEPLASELRRSTLELIRAPGFEVKYDRTASDALP